MNAIQKIETNELSVTPSQQSLITAVAATGNLKGLTPDQKHEYILAICAANGLKASQASTCFEIVEFQGKEVLYPKKGFAEAVRDARNIDCHIKSREFDQENQLYEVVAIGNLPNGRWEEALASLSTEIAEMKWDATLRKKVATGKMLPARGQDLANLKMKCETKAKRRVTLALCGLGLEEREFEAEAYSVEEIPLRHATLTENTEVEQWNEETEPEPELISENEMKAFIIKAGKQGWTEEKQKSLLAQYGYTSRKLIKKVHFPELMDILDINPNEFAAAEVK